MNDQIQKMIQSMSLDDKIKLCSGKDFWHTKEMKKYKIPSIMLTDGPHGLRKQREDADMLGINDSVPSTCFPTAVLSGSTWNRELSENSKFAKTFKNTLEFALAKVNGLKKPDYNDLQFRMMASSSLDASLNSLHINSNGMFPKSISKLMVFLANH